MPYDSGTPDSNNERYAQDQAQNLQAIQVANSSGGRYIRSQTTPPPRQQDQSLVSTVTNQAVGYGVQTGIKSLLSSLFGGGAEAAGGASIAAETVGAVGSIAEVAAVAAL